MREAPAEGVARQLPAWIGGAGVAAVLVLGAMLIALGWSNWPSADDFCNTVLVKNGGISGAMRWLYTQWSGRVFTGIVMYTTFALFDIPLLHIVSALLAVLFVLAAWQMTRLMDDDGSGSAPVFAFTLAFLVLGAYPLLGQVVYWPTGGIVYLVPLVVLLHWLHGLQRLIHDERIARANAYWFVVSAALGNSIELVVPIAVAYLAIIAFPRWKVLTPSARRGLFVRTIGLLAGVAILVTAPGNFLRGEATPGSFDLSPALLMHEYGRVLGTTLRTGALLAGAAVLTGIIGIASAVLMRSKSPRRLDEVAAFVLGGFGSLLPVLAAPAQFAPRNGLYLLVCLLMAGMLLLLPHLKPQSRAQRVGLGILASLGLAVALADARWLAGDDEVAATRRVNQLMRHASLRDPANRGTNVTLAPIRPAAPPTLHAIDVTPEIGNIVNQCFASYYDLASVRLAEPAAK